MVEQVIALTLIGGLALASLIRAIRSTLKALNSKRTNQNDNLQPLLGVVWPEETKTKRKK